MPGICTCLESQQKCSFLWGISAWSQHSIPQWTKCSNLLQCGSLHGLQGNLHSSAWNTFFPPCTRLPVSAHWEFFTLFLNIITEISPALLTVSALGSFQLPLTDPGSLFRSWIWENPVYLFSYSVGKYKYGVLHTANALDEMRTWY